MSPAQRLRALAKRTALDGIAEELVAIAAELDQRPAAQTEREADGYGSTDLPWSFTVCRELEPQEKRLMSMLISAFGSDHPAIDDMAHLILNRPASLPAPKQATPTTSGNILTDAFNEVQALKQQATTEPVGEPIKYQPGEWYEAKDRDDLEAFFRSRLPAIREAAREHGYAIGVHGSMRRDLDLIAVPWREGASDKDVLAHAIAMAACGITRDGPYQWEQKPLGRVAASLSCCWPRWFNEAGAGHIDLSVVDPTRPAPGVPEGWRMDREGDDAIVVQHPAVGIARAINPAMSMEGQVLFMLCDDILQDSQSLVAAHQPAKEPSK